MPYVYSSVENLEGTNKVGSHQCVALVQKYGGLPVTGHWSKGKPVFGDATIEKGTAIATFVDGKYKNLSAGNHAAFFISQDPGGIWIMDQWKSDITKPKVAKRYIRKKGKHPTGGYIDPSNNAEAYSVIE